MTPPVRALVAAARAVVENADYFSLDIHSLRDAADAVEAEPQDQDREVLVDLTLAGTVLLGSDTQHGRYMAEARFRDALVLALQLIDGQPGTHGAPLPQADGAEA